MTRPSEEVQAAATHFINGRVDDAERICTGVLAREAHNTWALCVLGAVSNARRQHDRALQYVDRALAGGEQLAQLFVVKASAHAGLGAPAAAMEAARKAVSISPDVPGGYAIVSELQHPGPSYYEVLRQLHDVLQPKSYVEIGVETGASIVLANRPTVCVGIDPNPRLNTAPKAVTKIMPLPSDEYFASRDLRADMECEAVGLAFVDGLHVFEQTLRDFINIERHCTAKSVVTIHDCLPIDRLTAGRERKCKFWTGDIWKVALCLEELRPDLDVRVIPAPPSGLCVVRNLDPKSTLLSDRLDEIISQYIGLDVDGTVERRRRIAMVPNRRADIEAFLRGPVRL